MANTESTVVNSLIASVASAARGDVPVANTQDDDVLFEAPVVSNRQTAPLGSGMLAKSRTSSASLPPPIPTRRMSQPITVPPPIPTNRRSVPSLLMAPAVQPNDNLQAPPRSRTPAGTLPVEVGLRVAAIAADNSDDDDDIDVDLADETKPRELLSPELEETARVAALASPAPATPQWFAAAVAPIAPAPVATVVPTTSLLDAEVPHSLESDADWFDEPTAVLRADERSSNTQEVVRGSAKRTWLWAAALLALGTTTAAITAFVSRGSGPAATAPMAAVAKEEAPAAPTMQDLRPDSAPAVAVAVAVAKPTTPIAELAPVAGTQRRNFVFTSVPSGAIVVLVEAGVPRTIGPTPITTELDPTRAYDVMLTLDGHEPQVEHVAAGGEPHLQVVLGAPDTDSPAPVVAAATPQISRSSSPRPKETSRKATSAPPVKAELVEPTRVAAAPAESGTGVIMVSSKPPCSILLDGKLTGLNSPQKLTVPAGRHTITLVSKQYGFERSSTVTVAGGKSVKVVRDYTSLIPQ